MAIHINNHLATLNTQRHLASSNAGLATSLQRLSSGLRINSAKDDAAGLNISEHLMSQVRDLNQSARNANDAISLTQTAEGALSTITDSLQRVRELTLQRENATASVADKENIQKEIHLLSEEIARVASTTEFNGQKLLNGSFPGSSDPASPGSQIPAIGDMSNLGDLSTLEGIDQALDAVNTQRAEFGATQNRVEASIAHLENTSEHTSAARSRIMDADYAVVMSKLTKNRLLQQVSTAMLAQANARPQSVLSLLQ